MSADAKVWNEGGDTLGWHGRADGTDDEPTGDLDVVIHALEKRVGQLWWTPATFENGLGLKGWTVPRRTT